MFAARIEDLIVHLGDREGESTMSSGARASNGEDHGFALWDDEAGDSETGESGREEEPSPEEGDLEDGAPLGHGVRENVASWEPEAAPTLRPPYDGFTSRATMTLAPTLEYAGTIVRVGGRAFLWKGSRLEAEATESTRWRGAWKPGEVRAVSIEHSVVAEFERLGE